MEELADKATQGEWHNCDGEECGNPNCEGVYADGRGVLALDDEEQNRINAEYIAEANPVTIKRLLREHRIMKQQLHYVEQELGKQLGFPWYKDDPVSFPNATEADGVSTGIATLEDIIHMAVENLHRYKSLQK